MAKATTATKEVAAKELAQKVSQAPAKQSVGGPLVGTEVDGAWGGEDISNTDIIIPKILLMQPMSELVTGGTAKIGEFRDSLNKERVLGSDKSPIEMIVFGTFRTWLTFIDGEYESTTKCDHTNEDLRLEEVAENGSIITRDKVLNIYCLLTKDLANNEAFPFVLSCRRTSYQTGKKIVTHIKKLQMFKQPSAAKVFSLSSRKEQNDKGTFFVTDVDVVRDSTPLEVAQAYEWYRSLAKGKVRVDDSDLTSSTASEAVPSSSREVGPEKTVSV